MASLQTALSLSQSQQILLRCDLPPSISSVIYLYAYIEPCIGTIHIKTSMKSTL